LRQRSGGLSAKTDREDWRARRRLRRQIDSGVAETLAAATTGQPSWLPNVEVTRQQRRGTMEQMRLSENITLHAFLTPRPPRDAAGRAIIR